MSSDPLDLIRESPLGTRMTVRRRIDGGHTDAVGYLRERSDTECVVETRRGLVTIALADVTASKQFGDFMKSRQFGVIFLGSEEFGKYLAERDAQFGAALEAAGLGKK